MVFGGIFVGKIFDDFGPRPSLVCRHLPSCLRLDDGEHLNGTLSNSTEPSNLLCHWSIDGILSRIHMCKSPLSPLFTWRLSLLGVNLVQKEARRCAWPRRYWLIARRRDLSHHGCQPDPAGRFRLGNAALCFPDIGAAHFCKPNRPLSDSPDEASIQVHGFRPPSRGAELLAYDRGYLLLLLRDVHPSRLHRCRSALERHVCVSC